MKTQTEEILWIATQEDDLIPREIVRFALKNRISFSKLLDFEEKDFKGISARSVGNFLKKTENINVSKYQEIWNSTYANNICLITYDDLYFPNKFKVLESTSTFLLYHKGKKIPFEKSVAIVGTRNCSTYAAEFTRQLSTKVSQKGYTVVSGLARGIDVIAHRSALNAGGQTIAVLAWMNNPYPPEHRKLLEEITRNGFAISDTYFTNRGTLARGKFVHRNEIISGISDVLVAVESSTSGGTVHQVEIAKKQNKTIIVLEPQKENHSSYKGFEHFVDLGALPVKSVEEAIKIIEKPKESDTTLLEFSK